VYKYNSKGVATSYGIGKLKMKEGEDGKALVIAKGTGVELGLPALPLTIDSELTLQLIAQAGECWETVFDAGNVTTKNGRLKAK